VLFQPEEGEFLWPSGDSLPASLKSKKFVEEGELSMNARTSLVSSIAVVVLSAAAWAGEIPLVANSMVPGATGKVTYEHDRNGNIKVAIETKNLAAPDQLTPAKNAYVVWIEPRDKQPEKEGVLRVNNDLQGSFRTTTPYKAFDVVITAEDSPTVTQPTGPEILHGSVQVR